MTPNSFFVRMASLVSECRWEAWSALDPNTLVSFGLSTRDKAVWNANHNYPEQLSEAASITGVSSHLMLWANRLKEKVAFCIHIIGKCYFQTFWNRSGSTASFLWRGSNANIWNWSFRLWFIQRIHTPIIASIMWGFSPVRLSKLSKVT